MPGTIWTIGHSTLPPDDFRELLTKHEIKALEDVRRYPGSKRYPHFNKEALEKDLCEAGITYYHLPSLGGRREPRENSPNTAWKNKAFRGYADYMETDEFKKGYDQLEAIASTQHTAYMCSEAVWWSCHRALISDLLKSRGWKVLHILGDKLQEHPYSSAATIVNGGLSYKGSSRLF